MDRLQFSHETPRALGGGRDQAILGVVASGNLEVLMERVLEPDRCEIEITTPLGGYDAVWEAVIADFVERAAPGGVRISINDGGAQPDTVMLRLLQAARMMEGQS